MWQYEDLKGIQNHFKKKIPLVRKNLFISIPILKMVNSVAVSSPVKIDSLQIAVLCDAYLCDY